MTYQPVSLTNWRRALNTLYEVRLVKLLIWSDWFMPLFGFSQ